MSVESGGYFDWQVQRVREADTEVACPIRIARKVLETMGVTNLSESTFQQFVKDLQERNLYTEITEERETA